MKIIKSVINDSYGTYELYHSNNDEGYRHREDGPALLYISGNKKGTNSSWINNLRQSINDCASLVRCTNDVITEESWHEKSYLHRCKGPAEIYKINNTKSWRKMNKKHRLNAPAYINSYCKEYWEFDIFIKQNKNDENS